ncbi:MAG: hypothetical protein WCT18_04480 [Patescibacteria group bacterium]
MNKETFYKILLLVVFGSGLLIFLWNLAQGRNFAKSPQIDLAQFEFILPEKNEEHPSVVVEPPKEAKTDLFQELPVGYVYFLQKFASSTAKETVEKINGFLEQFVSLDGENLEDLQAQKEFKIKISDPIVRNFVLALLQKESRWQVLPEEPPYWRLIFVEPIYFAEAKDILQKISIYVELIGEPSLVNPIARIKSINLSDLDRQKLQNDFRDVVIVK